MPLSKYNRVIKGTMGLVMVFGLFCSLAHAARQRGESDSQTPNSGRTHAGELEDISELYLWTLKHSLTGVLLQTPYYLPPETNEFLPYDKNLRYNGKDWPVWGLTMTGIKRLDALQSLIGQLTGGNVPGDFVECGVWRGGSSIFMRGVLRVLNIVDRTVHLVDSFEGLPAASTSEDSDTWSTMHYLKVPQDVVEDAFARYKLLDKQVQFHKGYFRSSLPKLRKDLIAENRQIALLRMDGDMYESTMDILFNLADLLAPSGCIIVDDWTINVCRKAMTEFFAIHELEPKIISIDGDAVYFCLDKPVSLEHAWYKSFNSKRIA
ncbi:Demethyldecarbamoylnovobiocin O-methyltransferase [Coccomyxa sp. Obi]|nr:Demethyldecarbamoylnovobiocin O-methyltransferase [Coccomyxa sp. Obi]